MTRGNNRGTNQHTISIEEYKNTPLNKRKRPRKNSCLINTPKKRRTDDPSKIKNSPGNLHYSFVLLIIRNKFH